MLAKPNRTPVRGSYPVLPFIEYNNIVCLLVILT